jgi:transposase
MQNNPSPKLALIIGIDWADKEHQAYVIDRDGNGSYETFQQSPEAINAWVSEKLAQSGGAPIGIILEQKRGPLINALMFRENVVLYPINPKQLASYRDSYTNAGCKDDRRDARLLARMLNERQSELKPWQPEDEPTRALAQLCRVRRQLVEDKTRLIQQLIAQLKCYFSLAIELKGSGAFSPWQLALLRRWPDPRELKRADRRTVDAELKRHGVRNEERRKALVARIRAAQLLSRDRALIEPAAVMVKTLVERILSLQAGIAELDQKIETEMNKHPDAALFTALPGAGKAIAPRLLTSFGTDRDRFDNAEDVTILSGIAPVTKQTGNSRIVHRRYACSKYDRQTFHEFADHARKWCPWSKAYYRWQRSRGMKHHATLRKLASRWIRILFRLWKNRTPYDGAKYLATLKRKNPAIIPFLAA